MKRTRIGLIGIGGYGQMHLASIDAAADRGLGELTAAVNIDPVRFEREEAELSARGVRIYRSAAELFAGTRDRVDLVAIPAGIDQHGPLSIAALDAGFHVLCEKPMAGNMEDASAMRAAQRRSGRTLAIGYQYLFSPSMQRLKAFALSGRLGALQEAKTLVSWPRTSAYYRRTYWAGKLEANGRKIFDSPLQNATAHFLQNMLYCAGSSPDNAAVPASVYGENYRVQQIESADTQYIRVTTAAGARLISIVSHSAREEFGPFTEYRFEKGRAVWDRSGRTEVYEGNGRSERLIERWDDGSEDVRHLAFIRTLEALRDGRTPFCNAENAWQHTFCIENAFASSGGPVPVDPRFTERFIPERDPYEAHGKVDHGQDFHQVIITGLDELMRSMYSRGSGFAEAGIPWAVPSRVIQL